MFGKHLFYTYLFFIALIILIKLFKYLNFNWHFIHVQKNKFDILKFLNIINGNLKKNEQYFKTVQYKHI